MGRKTASHEAADLVAFNWRNQVATSSNASVSTQGGLQDGVTGTGHSSSTARSVSQGKREGPQDQHFAEFLIDQAQQSIKTDIDLAKAIAPDDMEDNLW
jgi:hypothetical protein